jgi:hypothetical protein
MASKVADDGLRHLSEDTPVSLIFRELRPFRMYDGAVRVEYTALNQFAHSRERKLGFSFNSTDYRKALQRKAFPPT